MEEEREGRKQVPGKEGVDNDEYMKIREEQQKER